MDDDGEELDLAVFNLKAYDNIEVKNNKRKFDGINYHVIKF